MTHLILSREYPPAPYPAGGIGTYVNHITRLLAEAGETVHVIAQRWKGASKPVSESHGGKLIVHRVSLKERGVPFLRSLAQSNCPSQVFSWQAAKVAESLIETEAIDVVEAQEWEAPLYYLQLRRALGLGPRRHPPCLVHLHSPSDLIFRHNKWDRTLTDFEPLRQFEEYTIMAADGLVCPSRYLARGAAELFDIELSRIEIIPYPLGDTAFVERSETAWRNDSICYVGRLELRKGVVEWIDAAIEVARYHPTVAFDFIGSDTSLSGGPGASVLSYLKERIPRSLRHRFRFHGSQSREELARTLAGVSVVVVPSVWENLPFTCIEAMASGLPVLASPNGGMAELIVDGESGWIAPAATAPALQATLRRVLATPPEVRKAMGSAASLAVRRICANETVLHSHLEQRQRLVRSGAAESLRVPVRSAAPEITTRPDDFSFGVVVICSSGFESPSGCLESIRAQTLPARTIVVAVDGRGSQVPPGLSAIAFIHADVRLEPDFLKVCRSVFDAQPQVGTVSCWRADGPPSNEEETLRCFAIRTEALHATGWATVIYPRILASVSPPAKTRRPERRYSAIALAQGNSTKIALEWFLASPPEEKLRRLLKQPAILIRSFLISVNNLVHILRIH